MKHYNKSAVLQNRVASILEQKGITEPVAWLSKRMPCSMQKASTIIHNGTLKISYHDVYTLCDIFNCSTEEFFCLTQKGADALPEQHKLRALPVAKGRQASIRDMIQSLSPTEMEIAKKELQQIVQNIKNNTIKTTQ